MMSKNLAKVALQTDHGRELNQDKVIKYCDKNGISHNFSAPITPQYNGVVEKKNKTLEGMTRTLSVKMIF